LAATGRAATGKAADLSGDGEPAPPRRQRRQAGGDGAAHEGGGRLMKRNWFTGRERGIGHLHLRFLLCADLDSSCKSRLALLSKKGNCNITCAGRRRCFMNI
jgi:hypothetical protein